MSLHIVPEWDIQGATPLLRLAQAVPRAERMRQPCPAAESAPQSLSVWDRNDCHRPKINSPRNRAAGGDWPTKTTRGACPGGGASGLSKIKWNYLLCVLGGASPCPEHGAQRVHKLSRVRSACDSLVLQLKAPRSHS